MRITIEKDVLLESVQSVIGAVTTKNTLPILSNFLIETGKENIKLTATDLDIGITAFVKAKTEEQGAATVPAKRFAEIIKELPQGSVKITTKKNNTMVIESGATMFKILTTPKDEFPQLPKPEVITELKIKSEDLQEMIAMTSFAVSRDETRYVLNGICFTITEKEIKLVATDGRRLAIIKKEHNEKITQKTKCIIPAKTIQELQRNLNSAKDTKIIFSKKQISFILDDLRIVSRLIEGEFPDYKQAIPKEAENKIKINKAALIPAIKRASIFTTPESQAIKLHLNKNKLTISKTTPEIGETKEEIQTAYKGAELLIGFNPAYLLDVLKNIEQSEVELELTTPEKPGVLRINNSGYIYIVLPMQIT